LLTLLSENLAQSVRISDAELACCSRLRRSTWRALGERAHIPPVTQSQIAATLAALLGEDYNADEPKAGKPIREALPH
jgi:type II secretory pathway predicted ATPase ExeA